jgi:AraC-like DNA-binding protein
MVFPVLPGVISEILGVYLIERHNPAAFVTASPPAHLLHYVIEGGVDQRCDGRLYQLRPGDMLWYSDTELVVGERVRPPWRFFSVVFGAPSLPPPPFSDRLSRPPRAPTRRLFEELHAAWNRGRTLESALRCHVALGTILLSHSPLPAHPPSGHRHEDWLVSKWWDVEQRVRIDLAARYSLGELSRMGKVSPATLQRACQAATGCSPARRIKRLRLDLARGLLEYSGLTVSEVSERTGYTRVHEFSRDIHNRFGIPPSKIRRTVLKA